MEGGREGRREGERGVIEEENKKKRGTMLYASNVKMNFSSKKYK
jgi:hypothetical protein